MGARYAIVGRGPEQRLGDQPAALLRRPVPRVVSAGRRRRAAITRQPIFADESMLPIDPQDSRAPGLRARPAWRARRLHRRPRRDGHVGDLVADAADRRAMGGRPRSVRARCSRWTCGRRRTTSSGRGSSTRCCVRIWSTTRSPGPTPRSAASCSIPTARRCRSPRATSWCRPRCSSVTAPMPSGTGLASARLGVDAAFDEQQMKVGRRLAIKLLNASKFVLSFDVEPGAIGAPVDRAMLAALRGVVREATVAFEEYDHARALDLLERSFWGFTDDYLELVKQRAYGAHGVEGAASAVATLRRALDVIVRAFAPFLPYVTEEVWSWWQEGSVHLAAWPDPDELADVEGADPEVFAVAAEVLGAVRKEKALAKVSLKVPVRLVTVRDTAERLAKLRRTEADLREAGSIQAFAYEEAPSRRSRSSSRRPSRPDALRRRGRAARGPPARAHARAVARPDLGAGRVPRSSGAHVSDDPCDRHERQVHGGAGGRGDRVRERPAHGAVPVAAPARGDRAVLRVRPGHDRRGVRRSVGAPRALPRPDRRHGDGGGHLLRGRDRAGLPVVRGQAGRARRLRGRDGRFLGRHEPDRE